MTTALISSTAALATLVVVLLVLLVVRRSGGHAQPEPVLEAAGEAPAPLEATVRELSEALERAREENRRGRFLAQLAGAIELDDVLARTLEAASRLPGVDAAMVVLPQDEGGPLIATNGMSRDEATSQPVAPPLEGRQPRAVALSYRYGDAEASRDGDLIRGGLMVPLAGGREETVGTLAVFWRGREREASADELSLLEDLAASAGPTVENAKRFYEARQLAEIDSLTGLHNRRYFDEVLEREVARAHRYGRPLALLVLDLDDLKLVNDRLGHLGGDTVLAELGDRVREALRSADIACRVGGDEFAVVMPESTAEDAKQLYDRLQQAITARPFTGSQRVNTSGGVAELDRDDDAKALYQRADESLYRAKQTGKGHVR